MRTTVSFSETETRAIMDGRILGAEEAKRCWSGLYSGFSCSVPDIPYSREVLEAHRSTHILVYGFPAMPDGDPFSVLNLRRRFGAKRNGVCFSELGLPTDEMAAWTVRPPRQGWWLIRKEVHPDLVGASHSECFEFAEASGWELPHAVDVIYASIFWQLATGERLLRHHVAWCADRLEDGKYLRVGYNQPGHGFHVFAYPRHDRGDCYRGFLPLVPPDLASP